MIVLEDDIVPLAGFLAFMNHALHAFAGVEEAMSVSATQYAHPPPQDDMVRLLPITCSWGWATWSRAWIHFPRNDAEIREFLDSSPAQEAFDLQNAYPYRRLLEDTLSGRGDTWAVRWYYACFRRGGLTVHPPASYVLNTGRDGSGQHDMGPVAPATEPVPMERLRWPSEQAAGSGAFATDHSPVAAGSSTRNGPKNPEACAFLEKASTALGCPDFGGRFAGKPA